MRTDKGIELPEDVAGVLDRDPDVRRIFQGMRPSCQREYVTWVGAAKKDATRARRLAAFPGRIRGYGARHPERVKARGDAGA